MYTALTGHPTFVATEGSLSAGTGRSCSWGCPMSWCRCVPFRGNVDGWKGPEISGMGRYPPNRNKETYGCWTKKRGGNPPKSMEFVHRVFPWNKPSILGVFPLFFWKHPYPTFHGKFGKSSTQNAEEKRGYGTVPMEGMFDPPKRGGFFIRWIWIF